ncbi:MAG: DUF1189 family protein [Alphaproteobacteria bacterium]|nr:DUF1189 family protein [Alphaproteobacteria bacterium]
MQKLITYIKQGKGIGALWLLIFGALVAFYSAYSVHKNLPELVPYAQKLADDILPIKIENSKLVIPQEPKTLTYTIGKDSVIVEIDPTKDLLQEVEKPGFYLTRSYFYSINDREVRRQNLIKELDLPKKDYTPWMYSFIKGLTWFIVLVGPLFNFACFLIAVLFYAFCTGLSCVLNKTPLQFKTKMRLNTILFISVYVLSTLARIIGLNLSLLGFFLIMIALQLICVKRLKN